MQAATSGRLCWQCGAPAQREKDSVGACSRHLLPNREQRRTMRQAPAPTHTTTRTSERTHTSVRTAAPKPEKPAVRIMREARADLERTIEQAARIIIAEQPAPAPEPEPAPYASPWTPELKALWLSGAEFSRPRTEQGRRVIMASTSTRALRLEQDGAQWLVQERRPESERMASRAYVAPYRTLESCGSLEAARLVAGRILHDMPKPAPTVVDYNGGPDIKRGNPDISHLRPSRLEVVASRSLYPDWLAARGISRVSMSGLGTNYLKRSK